tara:strand:- start:384 stop:608 length:225 start_codon:yes stop_codon:yes gene_type:complete
LFEAVHSYKDRLDECPSCKSIGKISKQFNTPIQIVNHNTGVKNKAGTVVNREIRKYKEQIKEYNKNMKKENNKK